MVPVHPRGIGAAPEIAGVTGQCTVRYAAAMTTKGTPGRVIRVDDATWADYGKACEEKGIARAADLRMHIKREVAAWRRRQRAES